MKYIFSGNLISFIRNFSDRNAGLEFYIYDIVKLCLKFKRFPFCENRFQGRIQDFWKGVHVFKRVGVRFAAFISFFLNIP